jgi:hypothetical protein
MSSDTRDTLSDLASPVEQLRDLLVQVRATVEGLVFTPSPSSPDSVARLLSAVPLAVCEKLSAAWAVVRDEFPAEDRSTWFTAEDRLLLDMILAMYDDRRNYVVHQHRVTADVAEAARG